MNSTESVLSSDCAGSGRRANHPYMSTLIFFVSDPSRNVKERPKQYPKMKIKKVIHKKKNKRKIINS